MRTQKKRASLDDAFYRQVYAQKGYEINGKVFYIGKWQYRRELFYGLLSGYSRCCIEAYIKRGFIIRLKNSDDPEAPKYREQWLRMKAETANDGFLKRFAHCLCGECSARYRAEDFIPMYFYCAKCDWLQFVKKECNLCGAGGVETPTEAVKALKAKRGSVLLPVV